MKTNEKERETLRRAADSYIEALLSLEGDHSNAEGELADIYNAAHRLIADVDDAAGLVKALAFWCSDRDHRPNELLDLAAAFLKEPKS